MLFEVNHMNKNGLAFPLVYSCSGCSSAAQMANYLALQLDRQGEAEMSCIAGVGGNVKNLVRLAKSGRPILALDGCPLECVKNCLAVHNVVPAQHIMLNELGVKKRQQTDFDLDEANALLIKIAEIAHSLPIMETAGSGTPIN
ncbi:putative zinc-binding protein (plasmid) [Klebsiella pneumoniae]|jgi:uncharacterized metal-binding protein|uniref:Zinc-binding protein n=4 Tax=Klebsiella/Raoultella group TaxID=2890311 RepID=O87759_KLEPN|nr:putative zinc-binding protein [Klebsiella oxytoca]CAA09861.1 hypothetical protein [Klebsiella pneumoniae]